MSIITTLVVVAFISSFLAGQIIRAIYRLSVGKQVTDFKVNCCTNCNKRFRLVELIPVFGALLTKIKCKDHKGNKINFVFLVETGCFFLIPALYLFVYWLPLQLFLYVAFIGMITVYLFEKDVEILN